MGFRKRLARYLRRYYPSGSLGERTLLSGGWVFTTRFLNRGLNLLMLLILARLLGPAAIGIYGMALITIAAAESVTQTGMEEALIQHTEDDIDEILHTAWVVGVARGLAIGAILFLAAPYVATFFSEPRVTDILRLLAVSPVIFGLRNPGIVYFRKALEFHKQFGYEASGTVAQFIVGVGLGFYWQSVWALIYAYIALDLVRVLASYLIHGFRPRLEFDVDAFSELFGYGKWVTGSSILYFLYSRGDDAVVGVLLASTALGWYQMAYRVAMAPVSEISGTVSTVLFPMFSQLQDEPEQLRDAFFRSLRLTLFVAVPMSLGIISVAPVFVRGFLGEAWVPMTTTLQLVAIYGLLITMGPAFSSVWKATGRPDLPTKLMFIRVVMMAILIVPATRTLGIEGAALTIVVITVFPNLPLNVYLMVEHTLDTSYRRIATEVGYPVFASVVMFGAVLGVRETFAPSSQIVEFGVLVTTGVVVYAAVAGLLTTNVGWEIGRDIRWLIGTASNRA